MLKMTLPPYFPLSIPKVQKVEKNAFQSCSALKSSLYKQGKDGEKVATIKDGNRIKECIH